MLCLCEFHQTLFVCSFLLLEFSILLFWITLSGNFSFIVLLLLFYAIADSFHAFSRNLGKNLTFFTRDFGF